MTGYMSYLKILHYQVLQDACHFYIYWEALGHFYENDTILLFLWLLMRVYTPTLLGWRISWWRGTISILTIVQTWNSISFISWKPSRIIIISYFKRNSDCRSPCYQLLFADDTIPLNMKIGLLLFLAIPGTLCFSCAKLCIVLI